MVLVLLLAALDCTEHKNVVKSDTPTTSFGYNITPGFDVKIAYLVENRFGHLVAFLKGIL